jgi:hypothetical protein
VLAVVAGLLVHTRLPDSAGSDIAGDALYAAAAYFAVVLIAPRWQPPAAGVVAAIWCVGVELFQLTGLPERWGGAFPPVMLVLGTVFDARDLAVYVGTIAVLVGADLLLRLVRRRRVRA